MILVYRYRVKSLTGLQWNKRWPSGFDLNRLTAGSSKELALHAGTINAVCEPYAKSRRQHNRPVPALARPLPEGKIKDGTNFSCDARGNWFLDIVIHLPQAEARPVQSGVGIDLGLKDFAALSTRE